MTNFKFKHSVEFTYAPASLKKNEFIENYENRENNDYLLPRVHINFFKRFPLVSFPLGMLFT